eukprot:3976929-Pyramimonas_sp.AAC.1
MSCSNACFSLATLDKYFCSSKEVSYIRKYTRKGTDGCSARYTCEGEANRNRIWAVNAPHRVGQLPPRTDNWLIPEVNLPTNV